FEKISCSLISRDITQKKDFETSRHAKQRPADPSKNQMKMSFLYRQHRQSESFVFLSLFSFIFV
ncbi:MAG: hypothetical protein ACKOW9_04090, partial [Candidatus Paceibacterota bacterium]